MRKPVAGADTEGGAPGARPPQIGKNKIFWHKIVIFPMKYPKQNLSVPPLTCNPGSAPVILDRYNIILYLHLYI